MKTTLSPDDNYADSIPRDIAYSSKEKSNLCREYVLRDARNRDTKRVPAAHQQNALDELNKWYHASHSEPRGAILVLPTGGGKTFTAGHFTCRLPLSDGFKVLWLAHTHHLLEQALKSFDDLVYLVAEPKARLTLRVVSGAPGHFRIAAIAPEDDVVIASLQACAKALSERHGALEAFLTASNGKLLVVFDEAHHSPAPTYRRLIERLRERCPQMVLLGLTATPTYSDESKRGWLAKLFPQGIVHQVTAQQLMAARVLAKPIFEEARTQYEPKFEPEDYDKWIGTNRDIPDELVTFLADNRARNEFIANYYFTHRDKFGKTLIFADRWAQCEAICTMLNSRGVRADAVFSRVVTTGGTADERNRRPQSDNAETLQRFRDGQLDVLVNVRMLTEGTDVPNVKTVFLTRQTTSQILLTQMVGRALRGPEFGGTEHAYIVSFIDDWKQRICWAAFDQIVEGMADDFSMPPDGKRPPVLLIAIDLIRRLARQMDSGINVNPGPYRSFLPLGWFRVKFDALVQGTDEFEPVDQLILVYEHEKPHFDRYIEALKADDLREFEDNSVSFADARTRLEEWESRYFTEKEHRVGLSLVNDLFSLARHMAQNEMQAPTFFEFDCRTAHDLDAVAEHFIAEDLGPRSVDEALQLEYDRSDRFWRTIYTRYEQFKSQYDGCNNRLVHAAKHGRDPTNYRPAFTTQEVIPDREPTEELKEQVKSRDGYRCLACGSSEKRWLQTDHVAPSYFGGRNHLENLQTLCRDCNQVKKIDTIVFRSNRTTLSAAPPQPPVLPLPTDDLTKESDEWKMLIRRWFNFFYRCAAVDTVEVGERGDRLRVWTVRLYPRNDPTWVEPHLAPLVTQIRAARETAGYVPAPERIVVNQPPPLPCVGDREPAVTQTTQLDGVLEEIQDVETFRVEVYKEGRRVRGDWSKGVIPYPYQKALNGDETVKTWRESRFFKTYPIFDTAEFSIAVIDGENGECAGNRKLRSVRDSYLQ